jgi:transposase
MTKTSQWRLHLEKWAASGLSAEDFAVQHGLTVHALKWWRWKIGADDAKTAAAKKPAFVEVVAAPARTTSPLEVLLPNGCIVRVAVDFDEGALRRLLAVLR